MPDQSHTAFRRFAFWALAAIYTAALPEAIIVYRSIVSHFSAEVAGKIPLVMIIIFGSIYVLAGFLMQRNGRHIKFLIPGAIIVFAVLSLESNPNKHIHIPEYILLAGILYEAIAIDYEGRGIFILIFVCTSMLGIVDELAQGLHPQRHYGLGDLVINSASALSGVLLLMGLRDPPRGGWRWVSYLKGMPLWWVLVFFGLSGAGLMCVYLAKVQMSNGFWGIYPIWLLGWNGIFLALSLGAGCAFFFSGCKRYRQSWAKDSSTHIDFMKTVYLWIFPPLTILFIVHLLPMVLGVSGWDFN